MSQELNQNQHGEADQPPYGGVKDVTSKVICKSSDDQTPLPLKLGDRSLNGKQFTRECIAKTLLSSLPSPLRRSGAQERQDATDDDRSIKERMDMIALCIRKLYERPLPPGRDGACGFGRPGPPGKQGPPGPPGCDGVGGLVGPVGPAGPQGACGMQGLQGPCGEPGPKGERGPAGFSGYDGRPGEIGEVGVMGSPGVSGPPGEQGLTGLKGLDGEDGLDSVDGPAGPLGPLGVQGPPGPQGAYPEEGEPGPPGPRGPPGAQGADGLPGEAGYSWSAGPAGRPGFDGAPGVPGAPGAQGRPGGVGEPGRYGARGPAGLNGAQGRPGSQGPPGLPGANGFEGLCGLPGVCGRLGNSGADGVQGPPGFSGKVVVQVQCQCKSLYSSAESAWTEGAEPPVKRQRALCDWTTYETDLGSETPGTWMEAYAAVPRPMDSSVTYPSGVTIRFAKIDPDLAAVASANAHHRNRVVPVIESGDMMNNALEVYRDLGFDPRGFLDWQNGEIHEFVAAVFRMLALSPPTMDQCWTLFNKFDPEQFLQLGMEESLCLVDAMFRAIFHHRMLQPSYPTAEDAGFGDYYLYD